MFKVFYFFCTFSLTSSLLAAQLVKDGTCYNTLTPRELAEQLHILNPEELQEVAAELATLCDPQINNCPEVTNSSDRRAKLAGRVEARKNIFVLLEESIIGKLSLPILAALGYIYYFDKHHDAISKKYTPGTAEVTKAAIGVLTLEIIKECTKEWRAKFMNRVRSLPIYL